MPKNTTEAFADPVHGPYWREALQVEIQKLQALDCWDIVDLPAGKSTVGCREVYALKMTPTGLIDRYKARLVA